MKKLFSVFVAVLMAISTLPMVVSAAASDFSLIADGQLQDFVYKNLAIGDHTVTSSNEAVINPTTGVVTPSLTKDEVVSLTIDGGDTIDVTVRKKTTKIRTAHDFSTAGTTALYPDWDASYTVANGVLPAVISNNVTNRDYYPTTGYTIGSDAVTFEFDVSNITTITDYGVNIKLNAYFYDADGVKVGTFPVTSVANLDSTDGFKGAYNWGSENEVDTHVTLKYDTKTGEVWINGKQGSETILNPAGTSITWESGKSAADVARIEVYRLRFTGATSSSGASFDIDNFVEHHDVSLGDIVGTLPDNERAATMASFITQKSLTNETAGAITQNLNLDGGYESYDLSACNVSIDWISDNAAITVDNATGIVVGGSMNENVKLTATVTAGEAVITKDFYFTVAPTETTAFAGAYFNYDFEDKEAGSTGALTYSAGGDGSGWLSNSNVNTAMSYVTDEDRNSVVAKFTNNDSANKRISLYNYHADGTHTERSFTHCDIKFEDVSKYLFAILGQYSTVNVYFDLENDSLYLYTRYNDSRAIYFSLPESIQVGEWFSLDVDLNAVSRSYIVYINGQQIGSLPCETADAAGPQGWRAYRGPMFTASAGATMYIDNLAVLKDSSPDRIKANAAVNAAMITYGYERIGAGHHDAEIAVGGFEGLPSEGPVGGKDSYAPGYTMGDYSQVPPYVFSGGAAISWKVNGTAATSFTPKAPIEATFEVTAQSGSVTETATFKRKVSPAVIDKLTYSGSQLTGIKLSGSFTGKTVLVAKYTGNQMTFVKTYDAAATVDTSAANIVKGTDEEVRVFILDKSTLLPVAYSK